VIKDETDPQDNLGDTDESDTPEDDQVAESGKDSASDDESDSALSSTATNIFNFVFIGILMVLGGTGLVVYRRKMQ